ncbi:MAG: 1-acyl-sn-glycerol-3-phosphate acyltransferase [Treponema sp.]|jgi:1-acyl-sn-glycerol-3-phosphate acyltransferase|nr:1-acyl-sn-glycerol-3-phosphate acyltransferase [Treponema sp.]
MPYRHGRPVIDSSLPFRIATALTFGAVFPLAQTINLMQHSTRYKHKWKLLRYRRAVTVSNHTTFLDPVKIAGAPYPWHIYQTLLEATVEFPFLGTFPRLPGGVPIPRGRTGYRKILESCAAAFKHRRYLHFYPEGECFLYNQRIREFKPGAFRVAAELGVPVIPLVTVFSECPFRPWSFLGRSVPRETLVVLDAVHPSRYVRRDKNGDITAESVREFAEAVRQIMQKDIDARRGSAAFYRGRMERIRGLNDS